MLNINQVKPFITDLEKIAHPSGAVLHAIKASSSGFLAFGEVYFSCINYKKVKGWKMHFQMTMNLVVPSGDVRFIIHNNTLASGSAKIEPLLDIVIGINNYCRLTVPPGLWVAFEGVGRNENILMNCADIEHDPEESVTRDLAHFNVRGFNDA